MSIEMVCRTLPFLSTILRVKLFLFAERMEKPGSGLQKTVPSMALTFLAREAAELTT